MGNHSLCIVGNYALYLVLIPLVASSKLFISEILPRASHLLHLSLVPADPVLLSIAVVTLVTFFSIDFVVAVCELAGSKRGFKMDGTLNNTVCERLAQTQQRMASLYPAFAISSALLWGNTNRFDALTVSFVVIQTVVFLGMPLVALLKRPLIDTIVMVIFRCALFWTIVYATSPRDTGFLIHAASYRMYDFFAPQPTDVYYTVL
ncbi:hypothetical protein BC940DRAFT_366263 [Gongronella butleri]|nr:hypothetical protein BC940DRAFT_366263 [Gongronella butleri]